MENQQQQDPKFVRGIYFNPPRQGAPDFILGKLTFSLKDFFEYCRANGEYLKSMEVANKTGKLYLNIDIKQGKSGAYLQINEWKPESNSFGKQTGKQNW